MVYTCMYTERTTFLLLDHVRNLLPNISCAVKELTRDSLRHDVLHLAAGRHNPRAQVVQNQYLKMTMTTNTLHTHIHVYVQVLCSPANQVSCIAYIVAQYEPCTESECRHGGPAR